jgi:hypothetical protein
LMFPYVSHLWFLVFAMHSGKHGETLAGNNVSALQCFLVSPGLYTVLSWSEWYQFDRTSTILGISGSFKKNNLPSAGRPFSRIHDLPQAVHVAMRDIPASEYRQCF